MHCETKLPMADACPHPSHGSPEDISAASGRRDMGFFSSQDVAEMACNSPFKMWPKWHVTATKSRTVNFSRNFMILLTNDGFSKHKIHKYPQCPNLGDIVV
jgi:hypothetical protein